MQTAKPIELNGQPAAGGKFPLICTPLVGRTRDQILAEVKVVLAKQPDLLEWRVDFFDGIASASEVISVATAIKQAAGKLPLLFTRRAMHEGGEKIALTEAEVVSLYQAVCDSRQVDLVDFEMDNDPAHIALVRQACKARDIKLILSFHNFSCTPAVEELNQRFLQADQLGADIAKVAVMSRNLDDVLTLLSATLAASRTLKIPLISLSMGPHGALTRLFGGAFGSALTFAVGANSSAPGQVPIEDLKTALAILQKSMMAE